MTWSKTYSKRKSQPWQGYDQNDGKPGVVYILRNEAFKENWLKIGQTTKSGHVRAEQLNKKASTGLPKHHICVFEFKTVDCGRAEKEVHKVLASFRKGYQEFFEVDIDVAKKTISEVCSRFNKAASLSAAVTENKEFNEHRRQTIQEVDAKRRLLEVQREAYKAVQRQRDAQAQAQAQAQKFRLDKQPNQDTKNSDDLVEKRRPAHSLESTRQIPIAGKTSTVSAESGVYRENFSLTREPVQTVSKISISPIAALIWNIFTTICILFVVIVLWNILFFEKNVISQPPAPSNSITQNTSAVPLTPSALATKRQKNLEDAITETYNAYPYLATPKGDFALKKIIADRNKRIKSGTEPAQALREAVALIAHRYAPPEQAKRHRPLVKDSSIKPIVRSD